MKYLYFIPCDWQWCINLMHCSSVKRNIVVRIFCQNIFFMNFNCWIDFLDRKRMGVYITNSATSPILHNEFHLNLAVPRCWEPPGHFLCTPGPGSPGCVISIEKGVKPANATSAEKRMGRKWRFPLYTCISPRMGRKWRFPLYTCISPRRGLLIMARSHPRSGWIQGRGGTIFEQFLRLNQYNVHWLKN